jgi:hypothetical protein
MTDDLPLAAHAVLKLQWSIPGQLLNHWSAK